MSEKSKYLHLVLAHPESQSFNASLARLTLSTMADQGWVSSLSNLYSLGFDPCEHGKHYKNRDNPARFDVQAEQTHASETDTLPDAIEHEIAQLDESDLLILQFPMWWNMPPAMLKGWFDRVFVLGDVYSDKKRYEKGRFAGKKAMLSITVGGDQESYAFNGQYGDIEMMLWPVHYALAYVGYDILPPFIAYGVESESRFSLNGDLFERLNNVETNLITRLKGLDDDQAIPMNSMQDWDSDGTIKPNAPVYTPFIRHQKDLELA